MSLSAPCISSISISVISHTEVISSYSLFRSPRLRARLQRNKAASCSCTRHCCSARVRRGRKCWDRSLTGTGAQWLLAPAQLTAWRDTPPFLPWTWSQHHQVPRPRQRGFPGRDKLAETCGGHLVPHIKYNEHGNTGIIILYYYGQRSCFSITFENSGNPGKQKASWETCEKHHWHQK